MTDIEHWYPLKDAIEHDDDDNGYCVCGPYGFRFIEDGQDEEVWVWEHHRLA